MNQRFDVVVQLGSQVNYSACGNGDYDLAPHTYMRTEASALVLMKGIAPRLIISGGSNFGVRYDDSKILAQPVFTFEAFAKADFKRKSEATVIKDYLVNEYGADPNKIFAETLSATTEENAEFLKIILRRRPMFTGQEKIGLLTLLYHMEKALPIFQKAGLNVEPLFAENILAEFHIKGIEEICQYYSSPKGGKQYEINHIHELLKEDKSLAELMLPYWYVRVVDDFICADGTPEELEKTHTYHTNASDRKEAAVKLREKHTHLTDIEKYIKGPFTTFAEVRQAVRG